MSDQWNRYEVGWHTSPSPGSSYYNGKVNVWAEDDEDAETRARREVHRRMFQDYSNASHIIIDEVTRVRS